MTITNSINKVRETGNGSKTAFSFSFKILDEADLKVWKIVTATGVATLQTLNTDYTVAINAVTEGGTVTYTTAPLATEESLIKRDLAFTQTLDLPTEANFPEDQVENQFDRSRMLDIQLNEILDRSLLLSETSNVSSLTLPDPEDGKLLQWKTDLSGLQNIQLSDLTTVTADLTIASGDGGKPIVVKADETGYEIDDVIAIVDSDEDTKVQVEEAADEDIIRFDTGGTERMTIDSGGIKPAVGVGIVDADADTKIQVEESADEDIIRFDTGGTERLTIDSEGITLAQGLSWADIDGDTKIQLEEGADDDTIRFDAGVTGDAVTITSAGLALAAGARVNDINDEDDMVSNSATALATQQSIKAYVDAGDFAVDDVTIEDNAGTLRIKDAGVAQAKLKTSIGEVSTSSASPTLLTLPGGEYGFYPQIKSSAGGVATYDAHICEGSQTLGTSYLTRIVLSNSAGATLSAQHRYITASGQDHWIFILIEVATGKIVAAYQAPDHPMYGNGGDINIVPHPFIGNDLTGYEVNILDEATVTQIKAKSNRQRSILTVLDEDYEVDRQQERPYKPLHTGQFIDRRPVLLQNLPAGIKVRRARLKS